MTGLGAVILSYGPGDRHVPLLEDLAQQGLPAERCVVVHNPRSVHERHRPAAPEKAAVLRMKRNVGYGAAMNSGIEELGRRGGQLALLLTHDARLRPEALESLASAASKHPRHGVLGLVVDYSTPGSGSFYGARLERGRARHLLGAAPGSGDLLDVEWVDGSAMAVRLVAWRQAGPLVERYFMYFEEPELCSRMRQHGWRTGIVLGARAQSAPGSGGRRGAYGYLYSRNGLDWARRTGGNSVALRFALARIGSAVLTVASATRRHARAASVRNDLYREVQGSLLGLLDALRGRFGPPPRSLSRSSDIEAV